MAEVKSFRDLEVWQRGVELASRVYRLSESLPAEERFGLCSQLQRAAVSVPANVAEGWARDHTREFLRHLSIARGSLAEVETLLVVCVELGLIKQPRLQDLQSFCMSLGRMLNALQTSLKKRV